MLDSMPSPLLAIFWPLAGAAVILILGRLLPGWLRRVLASAAALASLVLLWSLRSAPVDPWTLAWEPLNLFRMSPSLQPDGLALMIGLILAAITATCALGIRGTELGNPSWYGLILVALAGCLVMAMSANLLTLVLGSAMLDLALITIALTSAKGTGRAVWRMAVPGGLATVILLFGSLLMSIQVGSASFSADFPVHILLLLAVAGLLRLLIYPIHPRHLNTAKSAATLFLSIGAGVYLLSNAQALHIAPILGEWPWILTIGVIALLAGGFLAWTKGPSSSAKGPQPEPAEGPGFDWLALSIHQTGLTLAFLLLAGAESAWPLLSLTLALGILAIYWDSRPGVVVQPANGWVQRAGVQMAQWRMRAGTGLVERYPRLDAWRQWGSPGKIASGIAIVALASLAGAPLTGGAITRWSYYGRLLGGGLSAALIVTLLADTLLIAALWLAAGVISRKAKQLRPRPTALLSMIALALLLVIAGIAPDAMLGAIGMQRPVSNGVSFWGLGLVYVLPWLIGAWLARMSRHLGSYADLASRAIGLDWLYVLAGWIGQQIMTAIRWLGLVGEGDGWWGWALIILALGTMFLIIR